MARVYVLNGPNLNRLGTREPDVYGHMGLADIEAACVGLGGELGVEVVLRQTNHEGELIEWLHQAQDEQAGVVLNPAAFTHYSYAVRDACAIVTGPIVEVHISNPAAREEFRHHSVVSAVVNGTITGLGLDSYLLGLRAVVALMAH